MVMGGGRAGSQISAAACPLPSFFSLERLLTPPASRTPPRPSLRRSPSPAFTIPMSDFLTDSLQGRLLFAIPKKGSSGASECPSRSAPFC